MKEQTVRFRKIGPKENGPPKMKGEETFQEFANSIKSQLLDDLSNQPYPFDRLVKKFTKIYLN